MVTRQHYQTSLTTVFITVGRAATPVTGVYDAEKQTITIKTPEITDERPREDYTELGEMTYYGSQIYVVLLAEDFSTVPDKNGN